MPNFIKIGTKGASPQMGEI